MVNETEFYNRLKISESEKKEALANIAKKCGIKVIKKTPPPEAKLFGVE